MAFILQDSTVSMIHRPWARAGTFFFDVFYIVVANSVDLVVK